jgi:group I intron endonuclease
MVIHTYQERTMGFIYRLDFANGKSYVGLTRQLVKARYRQHSCNARRGEETALYHAWRKYGAPAVVTLCEVPDDDLCAAEKRCIGEQETLAPRGYNVTTGGEVSPMHFPEIVAKIAAKKRGQKHSPEARARMSASQTGKTSPNRGRKLSEEWRRKMAVAHTGRTHSAETKAKMADSRAAYWAKRRREAAGVHPALRLEETGIHPDLQGAP